MLQLVYISSAVGRVDTADILRTSRRNNAEVGVTGALMFNGGAFAQVLEGPRRGVESTFERIQRDQRHGDQGDAGNDPERQFGRFPGESGIAHRPP